MLDIEDFEVNAFENLEKQWPTVETRGDEECDAVVHCRGSSFPVHSDKVTEASPVLRVALSGRFAESETQSFDLSAFEPDIVDRVLEVIYTNDYLRDEDHERLRDHNIPLVPKPVEQLAFHTNIYELADYLDIKEAKKLAVERLHVVLKWRGLRPKAFVRFLAKHAQLDEDVEDEPTSSPTATPDEESATERPPSNLLLDDYAVSMLIDAISYRIDDLLQLPAINEPNDDTDLDAVDAYNFTSLRLPNAMHHAILRRSLVREKKHAESERRRMHDQICFDACMLLDDLNCGLQHSKCMGDDTTAVQCPVREISPFLLFRDRFDPHHWPVFAKRCKWCYRSWAPDFDRQFFLTAADLREFGVTPAPYTKEDAEAEASSREQRGELSEQTGQRRGDDR